MRTLSETAVLQNAVQEVKVRLESAPERTGPPRDLKVKIYADGADKASMLEMYADPRITGFTTNPTLMRKSGVADYRAFAREILQLIPDRPISFEVFAD